MFTTVAYYRSVDPAGAYVNLLPVADQHVFTSGNDITIPGLAQLVAAAAGVASGGLVVCRLESPSLRDIARIYIDPVNGGADAAALPDVPPKLLDRRGNPLVLAPNEALDAFINSDPTAARIQWAVVWLADGPIAPYAAGPEILSLRWTATAVGVAGSWVNANIVFDEAIPVGTYDVVGFRAESATLIAARLVFRGGAWRPGVLGNTTSAQFGDQRFREGNFGLFGTFQQITPPSVDFLCSAADAAQQGTLDLVKVA